MRVFHSSSFPNVNKKNYKGIRTNRKRGERKRGRGREKREPRRRRDIKKRNEIKNQKTRGERASSAPISLPPSFRFPAFFPLLQGLFSPLRARASLCRACEPSLLRVSRTAKRPAGGERQSNNQHCCSSGRPLNRFLSLLSLSLCGQAHRSSPPSFSRRETRETDDGAHCCSSSGGGGGGRSRAGAAAKRSTIDDAAGDALFLASEERRGRRCPARPARLRGGLAAVLRPGPADLGRALGCDVADVRPRGRVAEE